MIRRGQLCDEICRRLGIRSRENPGSSSLNRSELMELVHHLEQTRSKLDELSRALSGPEELTSAVEQRSGKTA